MTTVGIIGAGAMGAAVGARLRQGGARVLTCTTGRSAATRERARHAGMEEAEWEGLAGADMVLSIVPPGEALAVARLMAPLLRGRGPDAVFADCNAVSPQTVQAIAGALGPGGAAFVDAGIIGAPPAEGQDGPTFYASGPAAERFAVLGRHGLVVSVLPGPVGAASGLKMSYGGITKGFTALAAAMMLGAARFGAAPALRAEMAHSLAPLLSWIERQVPGMYPKAYRWVAEMQEVATFLHDDPEAARAYQAIADLYARLAADVAGDGRETGALDDALGRVR